jgi:hypothetical protein
MEANIFENSTHYLNSTEKRIDFEECGICHHFLNKPCPISNKPEI